MNNLREESIWEEGIYQLERRDKVKGGPGGISNRQAQQLANRTRFLLDMILALNGGVLPPVPGAPTVGAGDNQLIHPPVSTVTLTGTATSESGVIVSHYWSMVSGHGSPVIVNPELMTTQVTGLELGVYVFRFTATDDSERSASADVIVWVLPLADLTRQGITQLSNAIDSYAEDMAATPKSLDNLRQHIKKLIEEAEGEK